MVVLDLVVVLVLGQLATRNRTDPAADEAIAVRNRALQGAQMELETFGGLVRRSAGRAARRPPRACGFIRL